MLNENKNKDGDMKIKNQLFMAVALPLLFAACEQKPAHDNIEPTFAPELTLTSEATMEFAAEGGEGVIYYTAQMVEVTRTEDTPAPEAKCDAEWVTLNTTDFEKCSFEIGANEGEAREAKIVVTYVDKSFEVAVKQAAKVVEEPEGTHFEATYSSGAYYADQYSPGIDNYFISLSDNGFDANGYVQPNSTYFRLDLYAPKYDGQWQEYMPLPVGEYHYDTNNTYAEWTFSADYSEYVTTNDTEVSAKLKFESGTLVVTEELTTFTGVVEGTTYIVTFKGEHIIANVTPKPMENRELKVEHAYALYYGDRFTPGQADNFYLYLSDKGLDEYGFEQAGGTYYAFDLYTELVDNMTLPYGTYTWDDKDTLAAGTISAYYTKYYSVNEEGTGYNESVYPTMASLTVDENGIKAEVWFDEAKHTLTFEGTAKIYEAKDEE